jgi:quercetin dioxygenase-like cupin family protein
MLLDLGKIVTELHGGGDARKSRGAVTLVKEGGMSVVLMHLHAGGTMGEHPHPGAATVQVLEGKIRIEIGADSLEAESGRLIAFNSGVRHSVEALEDSTLLLTLWAHQNA